MNHAEFANQILDSLREPPAEIPPIENEETRRNNAARCMIQLFCNRLSANGEAPNRIKHNDFQWCNGLLTLRNARITDHHWSTIQLNSIDRLHIEARHKPVVYILNNWVISGSILHVWVIPENIAYPAFDELPVNKDVTCKTIELGPDTHILKNAPNAPVLSPYYLQLELVADEVAKLTEAIKIDHVVKRASRDEEASGDEAEDVEQEKYQPFFTSATIEFLKELPEHVQDADWHSEQKSRYQRVLRDPVATFVEALRDKYIERLSPEVAGGKRHLSILKKNDYGKGGYHDHYWFAFYDPNAGSKTKSVQLFFRMLGSDQVWRYGFSMGNYPGEYVERLCSAFMSNLDDVAAYIRSAPSDTIVRLSIGGQESECLAHEFADSLNSTSSKWPGDGGKLTNIDIIREMPLDSLPEHDDGLLDEIGQYFVWAWPFFEASVSGWWSICNDETGRELNNRRGRR